MVASTYAGLNENNAENLRFSPIFNNVIFASTEYNCFFSLKSFAQKYQDMQLQNTPGGAANQAKFSQQVKRSFVDPDKFAKYLWGDIYYDEKTRKFSKVSSSSSSPLQS